LKLARWEMKISFENNIGENFRNYLRLFVYYLTSIGSIFNIYRRTKQENVSKIFVGNTLLKKKYFNFVLNTVDIY